MNQTIRERNEEIFGWMKTVAGVRRRHYRGAERADAACNGVVGALNRGGVWPNGSLTPPQALVRA